jgi:TolA-binding protein
MRNYIGYIIDYSDGNLSNRKRKWFEEELMRNKELKKEYSLFNEVNGFMRSRFDIDDVITDPNLKMIDIQTKQMISEFNQNPSKFQNARIFVENSLIENNHQRELLNLQSEAEGQKVNEVTKKWVEDWNSKNQKVDTESLNRRDFITSSLEVANQTTVTDKTRWNKNYWIGIAGFVAAATIALFVFLKVVYSSSNSDELFQEFYKPLNAYSNTTRNSSSSLDIFSNAIDLYKQGKYKTASALFSELLIKEPNLISVRFFSGITFLELNDYQQAIPMLNDVVISNGEYKKEALWYLGLIYLKTKDIEKASSCFTELAKTKGYYQAQAQELLDHLR